MGTEYFFNKDKIRIFENFFQCQISKIREKVDLIYILCCGILGLGSIGAVYNFLRLDPTLNLSYLDPISSIRELIEHTYHLTDYYHSAAVSIVFTTIFLLSILYLMYLIITISFLLAAPITAYFFLKLLTISPKGALGSIGIICFIIGNIIQLWATTFHS